MSKRPVHAEVKVRRGEPVERALRRLKKIIKKIGLTDEIKERKYFEKPSTTRRKKKLNRQRLIDKQNKLRDLGVIGLDEERIHKRKSKRKKARR